MRAALLLNLAAGALMPWAFAPYAHRWLGWLALVVPVWSLVRAAAPGWAVGFAFALGWFGFGAWWLVPVLETFGGLPAWLAGLAVMLLGAALALPWAAWGWLVARGSTAAARALLAVAGAVGAEWLRGHLFTGLPWTPLAALALDTPAAAWASVIGGHGLACWPMAVAAGLALAAESVRTSRWRLLEPAAWVWGFAALLAVMPLPDWTEPAGESVRVRLVQPSIPEEEKWRPERFARQWQTLIRLSEGERAALVVWPEAAVPTVLSEHPELLAELRALAERTQADFVIGSLARRRDGRLLNGAYLIDRQVAFAGKRHLVPFGEYLPFWAQGWMRKLVPTIGDFAPDAHAQPLPWRVPIGVLVCYESLFPEEARDRVRQGAAVLAVLTNDAWYGRSPAAWQHAEAARLRAMETGRYLMHATNTGVSALIAPDGEILRALPEWRAAALEGTIVPRRGATPYLRWGDAPALVLAGLAALAAWRRRRHG